MGVPGQSPERADDAREKHEQHQHDRQGLGQQSKGLLPDFMRIGIELTDPADDQFTDVGTQTQFGQQIE
mgnify:CR=1 FL=1